jgi:hypothetical protein
MMFCFGGFLVRLVLESMFSARSRLFASLLRAWSSLRKFLATGRRGRHGRRRSSHLGVLASAGRYSHALLLPTKAGVSLLLLAAPLLYQERVSTQLSFNEVFQAKAGPGPQAISAMQNMIVPLLMPHSL